MTHEIAVRAGQPAGIGERITAGLFDLLMLTLLGAALSLGPMLLGGLALPLLGGFAALLVYQILPCAMFRRTLGMRIFGLEIVSVGGRNADLTELLFRELIGRGLFGLAYFATVFVGIAGWLSGSMSLFQPTGLGLILFIVSGVLLFVGAVGQAVGAASQDGRGLADHMARTMVIRAGSGRRPGAHDDEFDEDDRALIGADPAKRKRRFALLLTGIISGAVLLPYALAQPFTGHADYAMRMELKKAERDFNAEPTNAYRAERLIDLLSDDPQRVREIRATHREALDRRQKAQEAATRASLEARPDDYDALIRLVQLLEAQDRVDEAENILSAWVDRVEEPYAHANFGVWLYEHGRYDRAIDELQLALDGGVESPLVDSYLQRALATVGPM